MSPLPSFLQSTLFLLIVGLLSTRSRAESIQPFSVHPANPHCFIYRDMPIHVIASGEHYGALVDRQFDFVRYFDALARDGMNGTRVFLAYREQPGSFNIDANSLAPPVERFLCPWRRSDQPGYFDGGNRFDLTLWDDAYFARLKQLMQAAKERDIIVEANLFSAFYSDKSWATHPFNERNNINGVGGCPWNEALTRKHPRLVEFQTAYVRKLAATLREFPNVYFEICNEPYTGGVDMQWHDYITDILAAALKPRADQPAANSPRATIPTSHLISWNVANGSTAVASVHPAISLLNFHYASPPDAVAANARHGRPIGDNETGFRGTNDAPYRMEAWEFMLAGGALFNHLDYSFIPGREDGTHRMTPTTPGGGGPGLRRQFRVLRDFLAEFAPAESWPLKNVIVDGIPTSHSARAYGQPGTRYGLYFRPVGTSPSFSVRWTGFLVPDKDGEHTLYTVSNDGIRVSIDDKTLIDNWTDHATVEDTAPIAFTKGRRYALKVEYFYGGGDGTARLLWTQPGKSREPVAASALSSINGPGLHAEYFSGVQLDASQRLFVRTDATLDFSWGQDGIRSPQNSDPTFLTPVVELPAGKWKVEWLNPYDGSIVAQDTFVHLGGRKTLSASPATPDAICLIRARP